MELVLRRTYYREGTNGVLSWAATDICYTIELPWRENMLYFSCIPEGRYLLEQRQNRKFGEHLLLRGVPGRSLILLHPANDALHQLEGCIAPVTSLTGEGRGTQSVLAFEKLLGLVKEHIAKEEVWLTIASEAVAVQPAIVRPLVLHPGLQLCA